VLLALLSGCSTLRLAYNNGPQLGWWWLDGYLDFSGEQTPRVKQAIDRWFDWHRSTQILDYVPLLVAAQAQVLEPVTPAMACRWQQQWRDALEPALERALQMSADLVPSLGEAQWRYLEERFAKSNAEMRRDFLQPKPEARLKASVKRVVERAETLYGDLDEPQRRVIRTGVVVSPFDPQAWITEREHRQRDTVATLRRLAAERADHEHVVAALRTLVERVERSPDANYRAYQQRLAEYNCAFAAQIHNATSPAQRRVAHERLKGWEEDLRTISASPR